MSYFLDKIIYSLRSRKVVSHIPVDSMLLDIGCGVHGKFLRSISPVIEYGIGIDKDVIMYKDDKVEFRKFNVKDSIPFSTQSFDIITMLAVLEHLEEAQNILNDAFQVLKDGGKLIFTVPTPLAKPVLEFLAFKLSLIDRRQIEDHKKYFQKKELKGMLLKAGFLKENIYSRYFEFGFNSIFIVKK